MAIRMFYPKVFFFQLDVNRYITFYNMNLFNSKIYGR